MDLDQAKEAFELLLHSVRPGATRQFIAWLEDRIEGTPQKCVGLYVLWVFRMYHKYLILVGRFTSFLLKKNHQLLNTIMYFSHYFCKAGTWNITWRPL